MSAFSDIRRGAPRSIAARLLICGALISGALTACADPFGPRERSFELGESDIRRLALFQPALSSTIREEAIVAESAAEIGAAARAAANAAEGAAETAPQLDVAQAPFLTDTAMGRAFLRAASRGRALAIGAPVEQCPSAGLSIDASTPETAAAAALRSCQDALTAGARLAPGDRIQARCGCRVVALGDTLLVETAGLARARAVSARLVDPATGQSILLIAEAAAGTPDLANDAQESAEDLKAALAGAETLALATPAGRAAEVEIGADGQARLVFAETGVAYAGAWRAEGWRRGRRAGVAALRGPGERLLILLIGYEPAEVRARGAALIDAARALDAATRQ